jgi:hypothetical protein
LALDERDSAYAFKMELKKFLLDVDGEIMKNVRVIISEFFSSQYRDVF